MLLKLCQQWRKFSLAILPNILQVSKLKQFLQSCLPHFDLAFPFLIHIYDTLQLRPFQAFQDQGLMKGGGLLSYRYR